MSDRSEVAAFIARLQSDPVHQIGYVGVDPAQIEHALGELDPPFEESFIVERRDGTITAVMGAEQDLEISRAWLYGPFIATDDWTRTAERLYAWIEALLPREIGQHELFFNQANANVEAFGRANGFQHYKDVTIMEFRRARLDELPPKEPEFLSERHEEMFVELHDATFPGTYYNGKQLLDRRGDDRRILVATDGERLDGYIYAEVQPAFGEGSIDFVAVDPAARGRGVATELVRDALRWMFSFEEMQLVELNVDHDNTGAERIYARAGFHPSLEMRSMRRYVARGPAKAGDGAP